MFYAAEAALEEKGLRFSSHSAVIAAFGREFAKPGIVDRVLHRYLIAAAAARQESDYSVHSNITTEEASEHIERAKQFVAAVENLLGHPRS